MFGVYFTFDGKDSRDYHLVMANMSSATADIPLQVDRDLLAGTLNRHRNVVNSMGTTFSDVLRFSISLMHDECEGQAEAVFTEDEIDEIAAWLTSPDYPLLFHMYDYQTKTETTTTETTDPETGETITTTETTTTNFDYYRKYDYYGTFTGIDTFAVNDRIYGLTITFTTNSPFAWSQLKMYESTYTEPEPGVEEEARTETIRCTTSERRREVYPVITINAPITEELGTHSVTIRSVTDGGRELTVEVNPGDPTVIDCWKTRVWNSSGSLTFEDLGIGEYSEIYWPRLYYGDNEIEIEGDANVTFEWREPRKVGAY